MSFAISYFLMPYKVIIFFLLLICSADVYAQSQSEKKPVGIVAGQLITTDEFTMRFELNPKPGMKSRDKNLAARLEFLKSLVAEKLWAAEAFEQNLDTTEAIQIAAEAFEKMFTRDVLYKKKIRDEVKVTPEEIRAALKKYRTTYLVNYLITDDEQEIFGLHTLLKRGVPFDTILSARGEAAEQTTPVEIVYGQMADYIEDSLFVMNPGQFTGPMDTPDGLYIFYIRNKILQTSRTMTGEDELNDVEKILRARKEQVLYRKYISGFMKDKKVTISFPLLKYFAIKLHETMMQKQIEEKITDWEKLEVNSHDVLRFLNSIPADSQKVTFFSVDGRDYSLRKYFLLEAFNGLNFADIRAEELFRIFHMKIKKFIEQDSFAAEGKRLGYHQSPEALADIKMWKDNYLFQALRAKFYDSVSVSDEEAQSYYKKYNKEIHYPAQVNILEILADNQEAVSKYMEMINNGADFRVLADSFTIRKSTKGKGGEFGWFPVILYGEIGKVAATLEVGDIYGPIKTNDGYSLIKVIGKKQDYVEYPKKSYEQLKNDIKATIGYAKLKYKIDRYTAELAIKHGFSLDPDALGSLDLTEINSLGIRYLGFGGSVTGVPIIAPNTDWFRMYMELIKAVP